MGANLTNIIITQPNGNRVPMQNRRTATMVVSAKQNRALNAEDTVDITVESSFPQTYNIGDKITVFGSDYKLNRLPAVKKTGMHQFQYTLQFEGVQYDLFRVIYDLTIDTTNNQLQDIQGDSLTGNLRRFMTVLIANANRVFPNKWALGVCPETIGDKTLTFGESDNCLSVLQNLCDKSNFNVEFDIVQNGGVYTVNLYERVGQTLPFLFEFGKGRGLYELHRENVSSSNIVTRLKVYGSTENITSKYRADRLCLPGKTKGQSYIEKPEMVAKYGIFESRKNFDDIKPTFTGSIESKVDEFSFTDTKFPFDLNATDASGETLYLINGVAAKIHFNTGNLAGYDFEVKSYDHATHKFTLLKTTDDRGDVFPSEKFSAFQFAKGDEYKVLDIAYSQEIEAQAEAKLEEAGNKYYDQNCQPKVQYGLSVTEAHLKKFYGTDDSVTNIFAPGDFLHIVDADIDVDKAIRIKSFSRNILSPYDYTLTISDITTNATITNRVISELLELDKIATINNLKDPTRARANWRSSREVLNMVFDPDGDYYTDKIKPNSIDTLALAVGAKSMQFGLTNTVFQPNFQSNANVVKWKGGVLTHYTINEEAAVSWVMADGQTTLNNNAPYYLYAKCERNGNAGAFIFTESQIRVDKDANYYHFLVGTLSSIDPELGARALALTYGFSMINGGFIKTGRIESADGITYFDLANGEIGGNIKIKSGSAGLHNFDEWGVLNGQIEAIEKSVDDVDKSVDSLNEYVDGAFADGIITEVEARAIEKYINTVNNTKAAVEATYNKLYENPYLSGQAVKNALSVAKTTLSTAIENLLKAINTAISDGKTTVSEKNDVDSKFATFNSALSMFNNYVELANKTIQDVLKGYSDDCFAELGVLNGQIEAQVSRVDNIQNTIDTAGWITTADGNKLYASKNNIISFINQSAESITINASKINLSGVVSVSSFNSAITTFTAELNKKVNSSSLGDWAYKSGLIESAMLGETIIVGGFLNTDYIKVKSIEAEGAKIGSFVVNKGRLDWRGYGYLNSTPGTLTLGMAEESDAIVETKFNASIAKFGVSSIGTAAGGACIYASSNTSQKTPAANKTYAGYFDGDVEVNGNVYCETLLANEIGTSWSLDGNGTYTYKKGINKTIQLVGGLAMQFANGILISA